MTTAPIRTTAFPTTIVQEISEFIESSDVQLASVAALVDQFSSAQKDKLSKLKTSAESSQKEFSEIKKALGEAQEARLQAERQRDDMKLVLARTQSEYEASQAELRSAQEDLQRVRSELEQATDQLRNEETARLALEVSHVEFRYERERLNGIVNTQHNDLKGLAAANKLIKRRIRHAAIAASVIVAVGLTTWLTGAHAMGRTRARSRRRITFQVTPVSGPKDDRSLLGAVSSPARGSARRAPRVQRHFAI